MKKIQIAGLTLAILLPLSTGSAFAQWGCDRNPFHNGGWYDPAGCWHSMRDFPAGNFGPPSFGCDRNPFHHGGWYDQGGCWHM